MPKVRDIPRLGASDHPHLEAVRLRLAGHTLREASDLTGLSTPTISAAYQRFLSGGWGAVAGRSPGRKAGEGGRLDEGLSRTLFEQVTTQPPDALGLPYRLWVTAAVQALPVRQGLPALTARTAANYLARWQLAAPRPLARLEDSGEALQRWRSTVYPALLARARREGGQVFWVDEQQLRWPDQGGDARVAGASARVIRAVSLRGKLYWLGHGRALQERALIDFFTRLLASCEGKAFVVLDGMQWERAATLSAWLSQHGQRLFTFHLPRADVPTAAVSPMVVPIPPAVVSEPVVAPAPDASLEADPFAHQLRSLMRATAVAVPESSQASASTRGSAVQGGSLDRLEAEAIHIFREVVAERERPVLLYSGGKDSAVMLHLARKAFYPAPLPFPLLHIDTTWKFRELYEYRDMMASRMGAELIVHVNQEGLRKQVGPFTQGVYTYTQIMKTEALKQALAQHRFDAAFGGGRRDEEKSRAKERICSLRSPTHRWDPKGQRPEPWQLLNTTVHPGESLRVYPLSNWVELDVWQYLLRERIPLPSLYFARARPVVERDGRCFVVDDDRMPLRPGEIAVMRRVRFRTLGCYPLTAAMVSQAATLEEVVSEILTSRGAEREGRLIDHDNQASMELKKQEGYF